MGKYFVLPMVVLLSACSSVTLQRGANPNDDPLPLGYYALPKAAMNVELYYVVKDNNAGLQIAADHPRTVPGETIPISTIFSAFSEDKITVDVDPATGYLKEINLNLEDRSQETLVAVAKSVGAILSFSTGFFGGGLVGIPPGLQAAKERGAGAAAPPVFTLIASATVDPTDSESLTRANALLYTQLNASRAWFERTQCGKGTKITNCVAFLQTLASLKTYKFIASPYNLVGDKASTSPPQPGIATSTCAGSLTSGAGICVRAARDVPIRLQVPEGAPIWQDALLPVKDDEYLINANRAAFATTKLDVQFKDGFAGRRDISRTSAALAIAGAPKAIIDAFIDSLSGTTEALSKLLPVRVQYISARRGLTKVDTTTQTSTDASGTTTTQTTQTAQTAVDSSSANAAPPAATAPAASEPSGGKAKSPGGTAAPAADMGQTTSADANTPGGLQAPQLWFSACSYGIGCDGELQAELAKSPAPSAPPPSDVVKKPTSATTPKPAKLKPAKPDAAKPDCTKSEVMNSKPACKPR